MAFRKLGIAMLMAAGMLVAGCATTRSEVTLASSAAPAANTPEAKLPPLPTAPPNGKTVVLNVTDERIFEEKPRNPATPSLGFGGAMAAPVAIKERAIARKRGGYGQAMGDVLLDEGQTVAGVVRDSVATALTASGYKVGAAGDAGAIPVNVRIKQLWEHFTPGMWVVSITANIEVDFEPAGAAPIKVTVNRVDKGMAATDNGYKTNLEGALVLMRRQLQEKVMAAPF